MRHSKIPCLLYVALVLSANSLNANILEEVYFVVNGEPITKLDFELNKRNTIKSADIGQFVGGGNTNHFILSNMVVNMLIRQEVIRSGVVAEKTDIENQINQIMRANNIPNLDVLKKYMKEVQGMDYEYFYESQEYLFYKQSLVESIASIQEPTSAEIKRHYESNKNDFKLSKEKPLYRVSVLFFKLDEGMNFTEQKAKKSEAEAVLKRIREGELSFSKAAAQHSDDFITKPKGGEMDWLYLNEIHSEAPIQEAISKTQKGELTQLLSTYSGFYVYRVDDLKTKGVLPPSKAYRLVKHLLVDGKRKAIIDKKVDYLFRQSVIEKRTKNFEGLALPHHSFSN